MASVENDSNVNNGGVDESDVIGFRSASKKSDGSAPLVVLKEAYFYKMDHRQRGVAVIFNHERFLVPNLKDRSGTQADCDNLKTCWEKIGFKVTVHQDLGIKALMDEIEALSNIDYSQMDCLVICVLSHGEEGVIFARDSAYKHENLWEKFTADKCKTLAGKPKLFFIQACQGRKLDPGVHLKAEMDGSDSYRIPIHADFLFAYSTIPGRINIAKKKDKSFLKFFKSCITNNSQLSSGNIEDGFEDQGWYIKALMAELDEHAFLFDLHTLLTFVHRRVAVDYEQINFGRNHINSYKQVPSFSSRLTRILKFTPIS